MVLGRASLVALAALAVSACEPCAGVASCTTDPRFVLMGSVIIPGTGHPAAGVQVDVRITQGATELVHRTVTTGSDGLWEVRANGDTGVATVTATLTSATGSYAVPPFTVNATTRGGDAIRLEPWLQYPYVFRLVTLTKNFVPLVHAVVTYQPSGGVAVPGDPTWTGETNGVGIFELPLRGTAVGDITGTLTVTHPDLGTTRVITGFVVPVGHEFLFPYVRDVRDFQ